MLRRSTKISWNGLGFGCQRAPIAAGVNPLDLRPLSPAVLGAYFGGDGLHHGIAVSAVRSGSRRRQFGIRAAVGGCRHERRAARNHLPDEPVGVEMQRAFYAIAP